MKTPHSASLNIVRIVELVLDCFGLPRSAALRLLQFFILINSIYAEPLESICNANMICTLNLKKKV